MTVWGGRSSPVASARARQHRPEVMARHFRKWCCDRTIAANDTVEGQIWRCLRAGYGGEGMKFGHDTLMGAALVLISRQRRAREPESTSPPWSGPCSRPELL